MNKIALLVFVVLQGILAFYLGDAFWNPSKYVYTFGGDGAFIYYNMIFHTLFGDGFLLESMNYPKFESLLMTDAQAGLSLVYSKLYDFFPSLFTPEKIVGWTHRFHYIMIGLAGVYFFKLLALLGVKKELSAVSAVLITLLSPMMIRLAAGHFGLAYPFVFAFTFYYLTKLFVDKTLSRTNFFLFSLVILFFGLNNFYIGIINLTFALLFSLFMLLLKSQRNLAVLLLAQILALVAILYALIHFTDPGMDRIEIQWGYFSNRAAYSGFLYPPTGLLHHLLSKIGSFEELRFESWINLSLPTILITMLALPLLVFKKIKFAKPVHRQLFLAFSIACFVMLIYASAFLYRVPLLREHFFHKIGLLTMFKASSRFAWPIFVASAVFAVYALQAMMEQVSPNLRRLTFLVLLMVSAVETHLYLDQKVFTQMYGNPYSQASKDSFLKILKEESIDIGDFQALYSIPLMEGWNDKFQIVPDFQAEYNSILFSMSTGIPMINGMLSRIGVSDAARAIQLSGNPLIQKEKLADLDTSKKIILVYGKGGKKLTVGEQFLVDHSSLLADRADFQLRSLTLTFLKSDALARQYRAFFDTTSFIVKDHLHVGFDEKKSLETLAGKGSLALGRDTIILDRKFSLESDSIECSIFVKLDNLMYGNPQFLVELLKDEGSIISSANFNAYRSRDIQNGWVRANAILQSSPEVSKIRVSASEVNQDFLVDELCIRPVFAKVQSKKTNGDLLYNNFLIIPRK